jgi:multidrug transporter EmrE-like cation transporter
MLNIVSLLLFAVLIAAGQFLFKHSAVALSGLGLSDSLAALARQPAFYAALILYGSSTWLWVWILTRVPLSLAYPVVALGMILVPIIGWYFFGERLSVAYWIGSALIIAGMLTMQLAA